ncbi:MAG: ATP-binding cassette domain-containing protein [Eubacterium sp.]|nr:ATP-binding cassette domain-containing protein [Eubacterium sp.]
MKIAILGFSGSGKSTLAKQLSEFYDIPLLYLDRVNFEENWAERNREECKKMINTFMQNESWVIDGNYREMYQAERLEQADKIIILLYNRFVCMKGAFKRNREYKGKVRESMADGCTERMDFWFFTWIIFKQYSIIRKKRFKSIQKKYPAKTVILKSRKQLNCYLENLK